MTAASAITAISDGIADAQAESGLVVSAVAVYRESSRAERQEIGL